MALHRAAHASTRCHARSVWDATATIVESAQQYLRRLLVGEPTRHASLDHVPNLGKFPKQRITIPASVHPVGSGGMHRNTCLSYQERENDPPTLHFFQA